jgi:hypothetical protein
MHLTDRSFRIGYHHRKVTSMPSILSAPFFHDEAKAITKLEGPRMGERAS